MSPNPGAASRPAAPDPAPAVARPARRTIACTCGAPGSARIAASRARPARTRTAGQAHRAPRGAARAGETARIGQASGPLWRGMCFRAASSAEPSVGTTRKRPSAPSSAQPPDPGEVIPGATDLELVRRTSGGGTESPSNARQRPREQAPHSRVPFTPREINGGRGARGDSGGLKSIGVALRSSTARVPRVREPKIRPVAPRTAHGATGRDIGQRRPLPPSRRTVKRAGWIADATRLERPRPLRPLRSANRTQGPERPRPRAHSHHSPSTRSRLGPDDLRCGVESRTQRRHARHVRIAPGVAARSCSAGKAAALGHPQPRSNTAQCHGDKAPLSPPPRPATVRSTAASPCGVTADA